MSDIQNILTIIKARVKLLNWTRLEDIPFDESVYFEFEQLETFVMIHGDQQINRVLEEVSAQIESVFKKYIKEFNEVTLDSDEEQLREPSHIELLKQEITTYKNSVQNIRKVIGNISSLPIDPLPLNVTQHEFSIMLRLLYELEIVDKSRIPQKEFARKFTFIFTTKKGQRLSPLSLERSVSTSDGFGYADIRAKIIKIFPELNPNKK